VKSIADGAQRFLVPTPAALRLPDDGLLRNPSAGSLAGGKPENQHIHAWLKVKNQNKTDRPFHHVRPWTPDFGGKATPLTMEQIQRVLAIPLKKAETRLVRHLTGDEMQALLHAPVPDHREGIRDRAMLHLCYAAGLRVSELVGLQLADLSLQPQASVLVHGKGRKERCLPLWKETTSALRAWLAVRGDMRVPELFVNAQGEAMTRSGFEYILHKHVATASQHCPSLSTKRVSPHVLRHTCALTVLQATKDLRKVSLWLGHTHLQTTEMYTRVDPSVKLEALESIIPPKLRSGRFKATDHLIALLKTRSLMRSEQPKK
jgi:integrase/recombinase XerD